MRTFLLTTAGVFALLTTAAAQPAIKAGGVVNAASYQPGIAPGSIFVVFGSAMGPVKLVQASSLPLQTSLSGTSISFTSATASAIAALMVYTSAGQLAALLPSTAAPGSYNVTVTYNNQTSAAEPVTVVKRNFGIVTADSSGSGQAQATYGGYDLNRFTKGTLGYAGHNWQLRPGVDGDVLILWGTGTGADPKFNDSDGSGSTTNAKDAFTLTVGGITVHPNYVGRSPGAPGLDQVNFKIPAGAAKGCFNDVVVLWADPISSNHVSIATANVGDTACQSPNLTADEMRKLDTGGTLAIAEVNLSKTTTDITVPGAGTSTLSSESAFAIFSKFTAGSIGSANFSFTQPGTCSFIHRTGDTSEILTGKPAIPQDAGPQLKLNGPNASNVTIPLVSTGIYEQTLYSSGFAGIGGSGTPTLVQGTYTVTGQGGTDIGAFTASEDFPGAFTPNLSGIPEPINRNQDLTVTWTGGGTGLVIVGGLAITQTGSLQDRISTSDGFICVGDASAGSLVVRSSVLLQVQPIANDFANGSFGLVSVFTVPKTPAKFTAPKMDLGFASYVIGGSTTRGII